MGSNHKLSMMDAKSANIKTCDFISPCLKIKAFCAPIAIISPAVVL